jgi:hypothetical protein
MNPYMVRGARVRVVRPTDYSTHLCAGAEHVVRSIGSDGWVRVFGVSNSWMPDRFKPLVRVKMGRRLELRSPPHWQLSYYK